MAIPRAAEEDTRPEAVADIPPAVIAKQTMFLCTTGCKCSAVKKVKVRGEKGVLTGHALSHCQLRSRIGGAVRLRAVIIPAVFILVGQSNVRLGEGERAERRIARNDCDLMAHGA